MIRRLYLVPARAGSQRLPGKNLMQVAGYSLIARAVRLGLAVADHHRDAVVCSTDSQEYAEEAKRHQGEALIRPPELARADTPSLDVVWHALNVLGGAQLVVLLQPTSPLTAPCDVRAGLEAFARHKIPVIARGPSGRANGALYIATPTQLQKRGSFYGDLVISLEMPAARSIDVDTAADLEEARRLAVSA